MNESLTHRIIRRFFTVAPSASLAYGAWLLRSTDAPGRPPVVVCGSGGSGTRVVTQLLKSTHFIGSMVNASLDSVPVAGFIRKRLPEILLESGQCSERASNDFRRAVAVHRKGCADPQANWLIKNPRLIYMLPLVDAVLPDFRFVQVVRDGRDIALSPNQQQLDELGSYVLGFALLSGPRFDAALELWSHVNVQAAAFGSSLSADRYLLIRFEDLVADPEATAQKLSAFTRVHFVAGMGTDTVTDPGTIGRWRDLHPMPQLSERARRGLESFGYC